ncbi:MAG: glycosyltransferase family 39 protein [Leptospiraceae bacterium]|nr:glycosyltransferase family 39 protein [Leptospiraceae bacterium]MCK6382346.1 glycosyltransferase family 39 protein [Leptospiraceae bacterium]NUM40357.1 glycosyltransferase family 39 protein [Leptospiraceae bacterium]
MVIVFILLISILRFVYAVGLDVLPDEAYYWEWSRNLDYSYYDQGPGVGFYIRIFTAIFGNTIFALKFATIFASAVSMWIAYLIGNYLEFTKKKQYLLFSVFLFIPAFFSGSLVIMHDTCLILFWVLALYFSIRYIYKKRNLDLYLTFISLGLGFLSKHTMVFFAISLILWLIVSPKEYSLLKNVHFYFSLALAFLIISPMVFWNTQNNWDNVDAIIHLRSSGGKEYEGSNMDSFVAGQLVTLSPIWFVGIVFISITGIYFWIVEKENKWDFWNSLDGIDSARKLLVINAAILPLFFFYLSSKKMVQANWTFPSYPAIILLMISFVGTKKTKSGTVFDKLVYAGFALAILIDAFFLFPGAVGKTLNLKNYSIPNPVERYKGYKEAVTEIQNFKNLKHPDSILIANRYQDAAIASWYIKNQPFVQSLNILQKNQYTYWSKMEKGKDYLLFYIQENTCEKSFVFFQPLLESMFEEVIEYPEKEIVMDGMSVKRYQIWYGKNYKQDWATTFFSPLNNQIIFLHSQGLIGEESKGNSKSQKRLIEAVQSYLLGKGEINCSVF